MISPPNTDHRDGPIEPVKPSQLITAPFDSKAMRYVVPI